LDPDGLTGGYAGLQRFVLDVDRQFTTVDASISLQDVPVLLRVGGSDQQPGVPQILAVEPHSGPEGPQSDRHHHHDHYIFHGEGDG